MTELISPSIKLCLRMAFAPLKKNEIVIHLYQSLVLSDIENAEI